MGLPTGVFHPQWIYHHRPVVDSAGLATILIERTDSSIEPVFDFETGEFTGPSNQIAIYQGRARIQKVAFPTSRDFVQDVAKFQRMRIQVGFNDNTLAGVPQPFDLHVNDRITVLSDTADPVKVGEHYYIHGTESSSNAWHRTITAQSNMKQAAE